MSHMFNVQTDRATHYAAVTSGATGDSFLRNCLRSFKEHIEPTLPASCESCIKQVTRLVCPPAAEEGESVVLLVVPKAVLCALEASIYTGIHYAFLMTHPLHGKKTSANVGYSTNPTHDVYLHNNLLTNDRTTSAAAPYWILDMVLGPFITVEKAMECCGEWVSNTRGIESKRKRAILLSRMYNVKLYSTHKKPDIPLKKYLAITAPPIYMDAYKKMTRGGVQKKPRKTHTKKKGKKNVSCDA